MRRRSQNNQQQSKLVKLVTLPFRALGRARDAYVRGLTSCAGRVAHGAAGGPVFAGNLPRSFSAAARNGGEDFRELLRAASAKEARRGGPVGLPKSCSVGMRRIDEDEACESFGDDEVDVWRRRRSTSDAVYNYRRRSSSSRTSTEGNVGGGLFRQELL